MANNAWKAEKRLRAKKELSSKREAEEQERFEKDQKYRYLPASYRAFDELVEDVGMDTAEKIKDLIDALIAERHQ